MTQSNKPAKIQVEATINAPMEKVWKFWTEPEHIKSWAFASPDWHSPDAENDLRTGGKFKTVMAAKDGSMAFDFAGVYTRVKHHEAIDYTLGDDRTVDTLFKPSGNTVHVVQRFDPENINSREMQQGGWQAILNNFKKYAEEN